MASRFNTLLHGEAADAADVLSGDTQPGERELILELRAALTNALRRVDRLEIRLDAESARLEGQIERASQRSEDWLNRILEENNRKLKAEFVDELRRGMFA